MPAIVIGSEQSEYVRIDAIQRSHPNASDYCDGNWIRCRIDVAAGAFRGHINADLRAEEFAPFAHGLRNIQSTLTGEANFTTMEEWLALTLVGDGRGHVAVRGEVKEQGPSFASLSFGLELDQTQLPDILTGLAEIERAYPVIGSPTS